jgi:hypothetical protein
LGQREHHREPAGFRAAVGDPAYEQDDCNGVREVYGLANEDAMNQVLGSAETHAGRVLAFPNILQHHVGPFRLADPPGRDIARSLCSSWSTPQLMQERKFVVDEHNEKIYEREFSLCEH